MADSAKTQQPPDAGAHAWNPDDPTDPPCVLHRPRDDRPGRVSTPYGDLYYLDLWGDLTEAAEQMGAQMGPQIRSGAVPFFADYLEKVLENSPVGRLKGVLDWAAHRLVTRRLASNLPADFRRAARRMSEAADVELDTVLRAYLMPETFLYVLGTYHNLLGTGRARGLGTPPMCGCTSAVTTASASGSLLHGRNFDYFGIGYWDQYPTVGVYHPHDGLDYLSVASAGILGGGITAMNAAGLTLTVHQHFVDRFDLDGVSVGVAGDQAMRQAHTIEEAVAVLRRHPPVAGWTYVLCEGDTGRAAIYEVAPGAEHLYVLPDDQTRMGYANVYWGQGLVETEVDYYPEYRRCNHARQSRVLDLLGGLDEAGAVGPVDIARILGDFTDPATGQQRLFGRSISAVHTVASVVFEPRHRRAWVAAGRSPTSRGWYIPFRLDPAQHADHVDLERRPFIPYPSWHQSAHGQAFELYRKACQRFYDGETDARLLILIEHALALWPSEPNLHILAGLLALRVERGKRAEGAFRRALERVTDAPRRAELGLFLAWALDLQGQRSAAKHLYKRVARDTAADPATVTRAKQGRWIRFGDAQARRLTLDFIYAGVP